MEHYTLMAVYGSRTDAERARDRLIQSGIPDSDIRLNAQDVPASGTLPPASTAGGTGAAGPTAAVRNEGFWGRLFGSNMPETHRGWYETSLQQGRTVLSVMVRDEAQRSFIEDILDEFAPLAFEQESVATAAMPPTGMAEPLPPAGGVAEDRMRRDQTGEQVIPVVKEELAVGKRAHERHYRIHTYVVETPVESEVTLRDERVVIEHRPIAGDRTLGAAELPQERDYEIVERHEEPVVEKRVRNVEEVVVRKEADERTERVRDTVRETRVDVEGETAGRTSTEGPARPFPAEERKP